MQKYKGSSHSSGVNAFEIGDTYIKIKFKGSEIYTYTYSRPGKQEVEYMKNLALQGKGLSTYISQHIREEYFSKS